MVTGAPVTVTVVAGSESSVIVDSMSLVVGGITTVFVVPIVLITVA